VKRRRTALPVFSGKTAWDLLDFITWVIQGEPKRYDQGDWMKLVEQGYSSDFVAEQMPSCGTIGCVAGWVDLLVTGRPTIVKVDLFADDTMTRARRILGLTKDQAGKLFPSNALSVVRERLHVRSYGADGEHIITPGDTAYAELGVLHIREFMLAHEKKLKRTLVKRGIK